jgi:hypothetical protein
VGNGVRWARISVTVLTAALVAAASAGCASTGVVHHADGPGQPAASPTGPDQPVPAPTDLASMDFGTPTPDQTGGADSKYGPPPAASVALAARFMAYPTGSRPWVRNKTGPFALDEFIEAFYPQAGWDQAKKLAAQHGMQGAARHGWFDADKSQTEVWLVKFAGSGGASATFHSLMDHPDLSGGLATLDAAGVNGKGLIDPNPDKLGNASVSICFTVGDTFVYLTQFSPIIDKTEAQQLAKVQYNVLKSGH